MDEPGPAIGGDLLDAKNEADKELDALVENISRILGKDDEALYSEEVVEEFRNPSHAGRMNDPDGKGVADGLCGDTMEFYVKVESGIIGECTFFTDGCGPTIACGNRLARLVTGMNHEAAMTVKPGDLISLLNGLPADHEHCAALAVMALRNAVRDYRAHAAKEGGPGP
jgi:nitrogen fixation NifU-like protein